jgi:hypothetical protein
MARQQQSDLKNAMAKILKMLGKSLEESGVDLLQFAAAEEQVALEHNGRTRCRTAHFLISSDP